MSGPGLDAVITGIGCSRFGRQPDVPVENLALAACQNAIQDAGLTPRQIDGLVSYHVNDSVLSRDLAPALGLAELNWWSDTSAGGTFSCAAIAAAAMAVSAGMARAVVVYRALRGRSGQRPGQYRGSLTGGVHQFMTPFGFSSAAQIFGMVCRRHMAEFGTTKEQLGAVALAEREHARLNERAMCRDELTLADYLSARVIADPYSLFDCCQETDGACAVVVSRPGATGPGPHPPVRIRAAVHGGGPVPRLPFDGWPSFTCSVFRRLAPVLYERAGITARDVDVALLYDAFTFEVIQQLEDFGFCGLGEGGPFAAAGNISLGGTIPVNPHGGLLSEAYIHGLNHVVSAVEQLRGEAGPRQVPGAAIALVTGFGFSAGSAMILAGADAA